VSSGDERRGGAVTSRGAGALAAAALLIAGVALSGAWRGSGAEPQAQAVTSPPTATASGPAVSPPVEPINPRWLAVGGGADPLSNQVSIEQNLALATEVLGPGGVLLFGGGLGSSPVHELGAKPSDDLHARLGTLFHPRDGRAAAYRPTRLAPHGPATAAQALGRLRELASKSDASPLTLLVIAHGEPGETARDNRVPLWGGASLLVRDVAKTLDALPKPRPLRAVVTTCFSGGFAELVFRGADPKQGASSHDRCGLFAATWDTEASGCDPNPDRRVQQSYTLHFFQALRGRDRSGNKADGVDLDGDGKISLLEAHTRARIASRAFSVPTSTSERWLEHAAPRLGPSKPVPLPEEDAVIAQLGTSLGLSDATGAETKLAVLTKRQRALDHELERLAEVTDHAFQALRIELLQRWPTLDDPYHPAYRATLRRDGAAIGRLLDDAPQARAYRRALDAETPLRQRIDELDVELAMTERLARAHAIRSAAARLHAKGGADDRVYQRLLACERFVPR
jgi:hypothetical protein